MTPKRGTLEYFRELFELAPATYIVTDPELVIQDANTAAVKLLRRPLDELIGKPLMLFIEHAERAVFGSMVAAALTAKNQLAQPLSLQPAHGQEIEVLFSAAAVHDEAGNVTSVRWLIVEGFQGAQGDLL